MYSPGDAFTTDQTLIASQLAVAWYLGIALAISNANRLLKVEEGRVSPAHHLPFDIQVSCAVPWWMSKLKHTLACSWRPWPLRFLGIHKLFRLFTVVHAVSCKYVEKWHSVVEQSRPVSKYWHKAAMKISVSYSYIIGQFSWLIKISKASPAFADLYRPTHVHQKAQWWWLSWYENHWPIQEFKAGLYCFRWLPRSVQCPAIKVASIPSIL